MIIAKNNNENTIGFLQLLKGKNKSLIIDLIAVSENYRGLGIAEKMISFSILNCFKDLKEIKVGTQLGNYPAMEFYKKCKFSLTSSSYLLHKHT